MQYNEASLLCLQTYLLFYIALPEHLVVLFSLAAVGVVGARNYARSLFFPVGTKHD